MEHHDPPEALTPHDPPVAPASVTIVMPCRNEAPFLDRCLDGVLAQVGVPAAYEVVVADGMSDDGSRELLARRAAADPRLRVVDDPARLRAEGINAVLAATDAEVVILLDAHTEVPADFVRENLRLLAEHPEAWIVGGPIRHRGRTVFGQGVARAMASPLGVGDATHRFEHSEGEAHAAAFPAVRRRQVFEQLGPLDSTMGRCEDDDMYYRVRQAGGRVYLSPRVRSVYYVRERPGQLWRQYEQYGFWRVALLRKHPGAFQWRYAVPGVFVAGGLAAAATAAALAAALLPWWWALAAAAPLAGYALLPGAVALGSLRRGDGPRVAVAAALAVFLMHAAYGVGLWRGLLFGRRGRGAGRMMELTR